ncbi:MAG: hypothetical protein JJU00_17255 [Opitutales bacterium]|nr:hypothetical protein [Opitutales bacterium]
MPTLLGGEEGGVGNVMVARRRGPLYDVGIFMVDRFCLGVKNAVFVDGCDDADVDNLLEKFFSDEFEEKDGPWCRKFVEGVVEYARRLGFAPHGDYKKASRVFGGVKAADCAETFTYGRDGKPFYIQGPHEDQRAAERIVGRLRAHCGEDGFHYVVAGSPWEEDGADGDDDADALETDDGPTIDLYCECAGGGGRREAFEAIVQRLVEEGMPGYPEINFDPGEHELADEVETLVRVLIEQVMRAEDVEAVDDKRKCALREMATRLVTNTLTIAAFDKKERRELLKTPGFDESEREIVRALLESRAFFARLRFIIRFVPGYRCIFQALRWMPTGDGEGVDETLYVVYALVPEKVD